jgi:hypothetical protein
VKPVGAGSIIGYTHSPRTITSSLRRYAFVAEVATTEYRRSTGPEFELAIPFGVAR